MSYEGQNKTNDHVQGSNGEAFRPQLHPRSLVEEDEAIGVATVGKHHGHVTDDIVHRARDSKEVNEKSEGYPETSVVEEGVALQYAAYQKWGGDEDGSKKEEDLAEGDKGRAQDGTTEGDLGLGLNEVGHGVGTPGDVGLVHGYGVSEGTS